MGGTCYAMGLMLAYNQFSGNSALLNYNTATLHGVLANDAGGSGRKGAQKIIIFETDGAPNTTASATFVNGGAYNSYYQVRYNQNSKSTSEYPTNVNGYNDNDPTRGQSDRVAGQPIGRQSTANGYSTPSKPLHAALHRLRPADHDAAGLSTLNQMQTAGNVTDGPTTLPSYKIINGTPAPMRPICNRPLPRSFRMESRFADPVNGTVHRTVGRSAMGQSSAPHAETRKSRHDTTDR